MKPKKPSLKELLSLCAGVGPEDGIDPRTVRRHFSKPGRSHKTLQLCKQVATALNLALASSLQDLLWSLEIARVEPAPDDTHLLAVVCPAAGSEPIPEVAALEALRRSAGWLRSEVAAAIHRQRVPELSFRFLESGEVSA